MGDTFTQDIDQGIQAIKFTKLIFQHDVDEILWERKDVCCTKIIELHCKLFHTTFTEFVYCSKMCQGKHYFRFSPFSFMYVG